MASGRRKSCLMVFGVGGFSGCCCSLTGGRVADARRPLVPCSTHSARLSGLAWVSWRSVAAVFDNSRYSRETWAQKMKGGPGLFELRCACCCQPRLPWYPWSPGGPSMALPIDPLSPASPRSPRKPRNVVSGGNGLSRILSCPITARRLIVDVTSGTGISKFSWQASVAWWSTGTRMSNRTSHSGLPWGPRTAGAAHHSRSQGSPKVSGQLGDLICVGKLQKVIFELQKRQPALNGSARTAHH